MLNKIASIMIVCLISFTAIGLILMSIKQPEPCKLTPRHHIKWMGECSKNQGYYSCKNNYGLLYCQGK